MLKKVYNESKLKLDKLESEMTSHSCEQEINNSLNTRSKIVIYREHSLIKILIILYLITNHLNNIYNCLIE